MVGRKQQQQQQQQQWCYGDTQVWDGVLMQHALLGSNTACYATWSVCVCLMYGTPCQLQLLLSAAHHTTSQQICCAAYLSAPVCCTFKKLLNIHVMMLTSTPKAAPSTSTRAAPGTSTKSTAAASEAAGAVAAAAEAAARADASAAKAAAAAAAKTAAGTDKGGAPASKQGSTLRGQCAKRIHAQPSGSVCCDANAAWTIAWLSMLPPLKEVPQLDTAQHSIKAQ
jgi:nucleoid-associated protein YgaU